LDIPRVQTAAERCFVSSIREEAKEATNISTSTMDLRISQLTFGILSSSFWNWKDIEYSHRALSLSPSATTKVFC
jgi:hypothetical protein